LGTVVKRTIIIILFHVVHWFFRCQQWFCRALRKHFSNFL